MKPGPQDERVEVLGIGDERHAARRIANQDGETVSLVKTGHRLQGAVPAVRVRQLSRNDVEQFRR